MGSASYDTLGQRYSTFRRPDPRLAAIIWSALGNAESLANVGAGAGSYEPRDRRVIAVEPSDVMIAQRPADAAPAVKATAEALPLADNSVDAALGVLTMQHWDSAERGLCEMLRVARQGPRTTRPNPAKLANTLWLLAEMLDLTKLPWRS